MQGRVYLVRSFFFFFSSSTLSIITLLLAWKVSAAKSVDSLMGVPHYVTSFSLVAFTFQFLPYCI